MKRFVGIALLSAGFGQEAAPPAPVAPLSSRKAPKQVVVAAEPTIVGVVHCGSSDSDPGCAVFKLGMACRDLTHWRIVVDSKEYAVDGWSDALKAELEKCPKAGAGKEAVSDLQAGVVVIARNPTAPWVFVSRIQTAVHDAGIHRICACESEKPITKVEQVVVDVDFDFKQNADRRSCGATDVTSSGALVPVIRDACKIARARGAEPLVRVRVHGACSCSTVARTVAECREAGATVIDVATKRTD
jgi:hypothetical protein